MRFLINCSNLKQGGGLQVADSVCCQLVNYPQHEFVVVLSSYMEDTKNRISSMSNMAIVTYTIPINIKNIIFGRDSYLDNIVAESKIDAVLTIFGPSRWCPRVPHLCGFARAQLLLTDSPYYKNIGIKEKVVFKIWAWLFKKGAHYFYTENKYISGLLQRSFGDVAVYTVSNYYNQIYDQPEKWRKTRVLPSYDGFTSLSISTHYPHKNFEILVDVANYLKKTRPAFKVRFVLTYDEDEMPVPEGLRDYFYFIGKVDVSECPYLYEQSDIMFMPTLMECFTATYPEAMRMEVPIITTDLKFARGLCGDSACYFSAVDAVSAAEAIYKVATNKEYAAMLITKGKEQLKKFDDYEQRAGKLIKLLEEIARKCNGNIQAVPISENSA